MTIELQESPVEVAPASIPAKPSIVRVKPSWREQRRNRRRKRVWFEEILGWVLVPVIVVGTYWLAAGMLGAVGTSFSAIFNGLTTISQNF